jgi:glycosyltransferase involved in cell wall biosynthesis
MEENNRMNGVSVIMCCYNSAERIEETLDFLYAQKIKGDFPWEIIIVNNASTDNTKELVTRIQQTHRDPYRLCLVDELSPGLSSARKKGVAESTYDLLIFCDDDNHFDDNYVDEAFRLMSQKPEVGIAGGWAKPKLPFYPGKWIEGNYTALAIDEKPGESRYVDWVFGAGMVFRKQIFEEFKREGLSLMLSGRKGARQTSGDDAEMCYLARFIGYKVYYSASLILHHKISPHRLTRWSFVKANFLNVYPVVYFYLLESLMKRPDALAKSIYVRFFGSRLYQLMYFLPRIFFGKYNFYSFILFFQNFQLLGWLFFKGNGFATTYRQIKTNLYHGDR